MRNNINIFSYKVCVCGCTTCIRDVDISFYCAMLCRLYCHYNMHVRVYGCVWQSMEICTRIGGKKEKCLRLNIKFSCVFFSSS